MPMSTFDAIYEFNQVAARINPLVRELIYQNKPIPATDMNATVERALFFWARINEGMNLIPKYETLIQ